MIGFKQTIKVQQFGNVNSRIVLDEYKGEPLDAVIELNSGMLCTVKGSNLKNFIDDFTEIINKYKV